ncbi:MAG: hypothetical protein GY696_14660 [Gammaproteobacteria bacterium]|nr:hypothetical protein [Gammaproteobacteria bacterium]
MASLERRTYVEIKMRHPPNLRKIFSISALAGQTPGDSLTDGPRIWTLHFQYREADLQWR